MLIVPARPNIHSTTSGTHKEDQNKEFKRRVARFMHELRALKDEINNTQSDEMVVSVIKDFLDQISNLRRKKTEQHFYAHT